MSHASTSPVGLTGQIITPTRGSAGPGEVEVRIRGGTEIFFARSDAPLPSGQDVLVVESLGARTVLVVALTEGDPPAVLPDTPNPLQL